LPAATTNDPLHRDLKDLGVGEQWIISEERKEIYTDPLLAVLFELRNYEVHIELRTGKVKNFHSLFAYETRPEDEPEDIELGDKVFISKIDFDSLSQLRNVRTRRSTVTPEMIEWFNRQADIWPASYLLGIARERYASYLAKYLKRNGVE
jgi:hypothetical protein